MRELRLKVRALCVVLVSSLLSPAVYATPLRGFTSRTHGFTIQYPNNWHPEIASDVFYIENFPSSEAVRAVRLPARGAGIKVLVPSQVLRGDRSSPRDLDDWIKRATSRMEAVERHALRIENSSSKLLIMEIKHICCTVPPFQESVDWYFEIEGHMFVAMLYYWQGNPDTDSLREVLKAVVLSIRIIRP